MTRGTLVLKQSRRHGEAGLTDKYFNKTHQMASPADEPSERTPIRYAIGMLYLLLSKDVEHK